MKTNKRILSAVLASTVALSSYAAYADVVDNQSQDNVVTNGSEESQTGLTLKAPTGVNLPAGSINKTEDGNKTVWTANLKANDLRNLPFSPVDKSVGRNEAGYYLGFNVEKPDGLAANYNGGKPKYRKIFAFFNKGVTTDTILSDARWSNGSGTYDGDGSYMGCWFNLQYQWLKSCRENNKVLVYGLEFDWGNDTKQTVLVIADPSSVDTDTFYYENCGDAHTFGADNICTMCGRDSVEITGISGGIKDVDTMTGDNLTRYNDNLNCYSFGRVTTKEDGNYEVTCRVNVGKMKTATEGGAAGYKNVLAVVELDNIKNFAIGNISKDGEELDNASWVSDGAKFVAESNRKNNKMYVTLWMSMVPGVDGKIPDRTYTFKPSKDSTKTKTLTVKFEDTTKYTLTSDVTNDDYTVTPGTVGANGKATVTVTPETGKTITAATLTKNDTTTVALTPKGDGSYTAEVTVKDLLTTTQIQNGDVAAKITNTDGAGKLSVTVANQSETVKAVGMTVAIENPPTMAGDAGLTRYQNNRKLYVDSLVWNATSKTATVKVPAELMTGSGATGTGAANVCLILELQDKLTAADGKFNFKALGDADGWASTEVDVLDGYKFVTGNKTEAADQGRYVVLWIGAGSAAFSGDTKTVIYTDGAGNPVATVNLVKVPGVKRNATTTATSADATNENIIAAAQSLLTGTDKATAVNYEVTGLATVDGTTTATVKVTPKDDTVLVNAAGKVATSLDLSVNVTVTAETKFTADTTGVTGGTVTLKVGNVEMSGDGVAAGTTVTIVENRDTGKTSGSVTVKNTLTGETVTVTDNAFVMPIGGVTITGTFTAPSSGGSGTGGGSSSGSSGSGGSSSRPSGGSGSSSSTPTYLNVTGKTISTASNVVNGTERVTANSSNSTGVAVSVAKSDDKVSYVKIDSPSNTSEIAIWAEATVRKANSDKLADVKKAAEEAINAVANSKGFAMNIDILNTDRKTVIPGKNVQLTVPVPEAYKGKKLYAYRITERGVAPILAAASNDKITLNAGEAGTYIITTEKLENALTQKRGDIDNGGAVSASDATLVLKHIVELGELKDEKLYFADVNEDGKINAKDATEILKIAAGITK